jgi:hypothetical protein
MPSKALDALLSAVVEIEDLARANAVAGSVPKDPLRSRALGRASVVLLCSHFERYLHALIEELVGFLNSSNVSNNQIPEEFRLLHSKNAIDDLALIEWNKRTEKLGIFVESEAWMWSKAPGSGTISHTHLLNWMKSPKVKSIIRMFRYWQINDIFAEITSKPHTRQDLLLRLTELVDKRNNIAHGDITTEASPREVKLYSMAVVTFCKRADRRMSIQIARIFDLSRPW